MLKPANKGVGDPEEVIGNYSKFETSAYTLRQRVHHNLQVNTAVAFRHKGSIQQRVNLEVLA
jgi:hypothetical protein